MFGKIIDGRLQIARQIIKNKNGGTISNPKTEELIANGYKEIEYTEKPTFDREEETLYELYNETNDKIIVNYETRILTDYEHNEVIKREIEEEENKITARNIRGALLGIEYDINEINKIENKIAELRVKLRPIPEEEGNE